MRSDLRVYFGRHRAVIATKARSVLAIDQCIMPTQRGNILKGDGKRFGMGGGAKLQWVLDGSPSGVQGRSPGRRSGVRSPPEAEEFFTVITSKFYAFFDSISHMFTYICLCFSVLAGIIPLSLRNGGGAFDTVCPLSATAPYVPPRLRRLWTLCVDGHCLSVCLSERPSVCLVPDPKSRTEQR